MSTALATLAGKLAERVGMDSVDPQELITTLRQTAFKGDASDAQFIALLIVANQYGLNPWTKEIYAFPDKQNGIVPVVGVDGWSRIINENQQFDGMDFEQDNESCTCRIYRKDRNHPICVTEWMDECRREPFKTRDGREITGPWQSHPKRMLRHKAMIQCARLAFGFAGIFDQDEAERVIEGTTAEVHIGHESDHRRPELIAKGEQAARSGAEEFKKFWLSLGNEERQVIGKTEKKRLYEMSLTSEGAIEGQTVEGDE
ncbi:phage recombination protein Bet [Salmonella enterica subsp. enterica serovar Newport]|nr:phage recombination protein Bet [Salmonella enterica subsp. enterica serovar Newport]